MARLSTKEQLLGEVALFSTCSQREIRAIAGLADEVSVGAGSVLAREGATGREFFVIAEGTATVTRGGDELARLGPGAFFGEMSLLDTQPRTATVTAVTDMSLYVLDPRSFSTLLDEAPAVGRKIAAGLAQRLRAAETAEEFSLTA